jgi:hypothetical protein
MPNFNNYSKYFESRFLHIHNKCNIYEILKKRLFHFRQNLQRKTIHKKQNLKCVVTQSIKILGNLIK